MSGTATHTTSVLGAFTERSERNGQCERGRAKRLKREATHVSRLHMGGEKTARVGDSGSVDGVKQQREGMGL
jgi:hypothetical protein